MLDMSIACVKGAMKVVAVRVSIDLETRGQGRLLNPSPSRSTPTHPTSLPNGPAAFGTGPPSSGMVHQPPSCTATLDLEGSLRPRP